ncbi:MAG: hypothetical protein OEX12_00220 [Gammaproteobacteria bacterium]|nr:hypothetical protein [Gammaproteobacteria bacterium]
MISDDRKAFEEWIQKPPYEENTPRYTEKDSWPGQYQSINVQLAWEAWQAGQNLGHAGEN